MHFIFSNKVDLCQATSVLISTRRVSWKYVWHEQVLFSSDSNLKTYGISRLTNTSLDPKIALVWLHIKMLFHIYLITCFKKASNFKVIKFLLICLLCMNKFHILLYFCRNELKKSKEPKTRQTIRRNGNKNQFCEDRERKTMFRITYVFHVSISSTFYSRIFHTKLLFEAIL